MIRKELEKIKLADRKDEAGYKAEEQLAFYLCRHFENDAAIYVYNGLRLKVGTDVAQPDVLILHSHGLIIVECKSCTTAIKVNEHGDWYRVFHGENVSIQSPIKQAERQGKFLVDLLGKHQNNILENYQRNIRTQYIVSYSDDADIGGIPAEFRVRVCKADQVPERIKSIIATQKAKCENNGGGLTATELDRIEKLLVATHVSSPFALKVKDPIPATPTTVENRENTIHATCRHCGSHNATIMKGRYGFYSKCVECSRNTSLRPVCHYCKCDCDVKSSGGYHYAVCPICNWARGYVTRPASANSMGGQASGSSRTDINDITAAILTSTVRKPTITASGQITNQGYQRPPTSPPIPPIYVHNTRRPNVQYNRQNTNQRFLERPKSETVKQIINSLVKFITGCVIFIVFMFIVVFIFAILLPALFHH